MLTRRGPDFAGRTVLVTGGTRGIGYATAKLFLEYGANVAICATNQERLRETAAALIQFGNVEAIRADVSRYNDVEAFVEKAHKRFHSVDVLVNNAGLAWSGDYVDGSKRDIDDIIDVNVKGVLYAAHVALPYMLRARRGVIINVSSGAGLSGFSGLAAYCASKFAVVGFTQSLALEVEAQGVRIYAVCPGRVATDMQEMVSGRRVGMRPERVAKAIANLAGPSPAIRTGECLEL